MGRPTGITRALAGIVVACTAAGSSVTGAVAQAVPAGPVVSVIELAPGPGSLQIRGSVQGSAGTVTATLAIAHGGTGGTSTIRQSREVTLDGSAAQVASTSINFGEGSHLTVDLVVEAGGTVIARSRTEIGQR